jgi:hypothetical protein
MSYDLTNNDAVEVKANPGISGKFSGDFERICNQSEYHSSI